MLNSSSNCARTFQSSIPARNVHRRNGDQTVHGIRNKEFEAHRFKACDQRLLILPVTLPSGLEPFFEDKPQRFAQAVNQGDRRGVMIEAIASPIAHRRCEVKVPTCAPAFSGVHDLFHSPFHSDGRHSREAR